MASFLKPKLDPLFYDSAPKKTTPSCGISVKGEYNPEICFHGYEINMGCKVSAYQTLPFFMNNFGPKYTEYTTTSHEQLPGHHLEVCVGLVRVDEALTIDGTMISKERQLISGSKKK